jgi:hypothetical protein
MNLGAMGAGHFVGLDFFVCPELFLDHLAGRGELRGGRATDENSFCHGVGVLGWTSALLTEAIYDPRLIDIVRGHFELHPIANGEADKTFPHFARDVGEDHVVIWEADAEHCARQD